MPLTNYRLPGVLPPLRYIFWWICDRYGRHIGVRECGCPPDSQVLLLLQLLWLLEVIIILLRWPLHKGVPHSWTKNFRRVVATHINTGRRDRAHLFYSRVFYLSRVVIFDIVPKPKVHVRQVDGHHDHLISINFVWVVPRAENSEDVSVEQTVFRATKLIHTFDQIKQLNLLLAFLVAINIEHKFENLSAPNALWKKKYRLK